MALDSALYNILAHKVNAISEIRLNAELVVSPDAELGSGVRE